jgi:hypothetical protein
MRFDVDMTVNGMILSITNIFASSKEDAIEKAKKDALHMGYAITTKIKVRKKREHHDQVTC